MYETQFISKYDKNGKTFVLWRKGSYSYELSSNIQPFQVVLKFNNTSLGDVHNYLEESGYEKVIF
jgi:hypothetical protein